MPEKRSSIDHFEEQIAEILGQPQPTDEEDTAAEKPEDTAHDD